MIKLIDLLDEGIFDLFNKKEPIKPTPKPYKPSKPEYNVGGVSITIEGISQGYNVWKGNDPIGDIRQYMRGGGEGFKTLDKNGKTYTYYYNADLQDHVGRDAYFTISSPDPNSKSTIEKIAKEVEIKAIKNRMINPYNL
jgi:hypothetical protein